MATNPYPKDPNTFQSPDKRGNKEDWLRGATGTSYPREAIRFNPLISGATKKTRRVVMDLQRICQKFQSPDKRGNKEDPETLIYGRFIAWKFQSPDKRGNKEDVSAILYNADNQAPKFQSPDKRGNKEDQAPQEGLRVHSVVWFQSPDKRGNKED